RRDAQLEAVGIAELEHPHPPGAVGRRTQYLAARCRHPGMSGVDVGAAGGVELEIKSLPLDPVPTQLAIVLVEDDPDVASDHDGTMRHTVTFILLSHGKAQNVAVPRD